MENGNKFYYNKKQNNDLKMLAPGFVQKSKAQPYNYYFGNKFDNFGQRPFQLKTNQNYLPDINWKKMKKFKIFGRNVFRKKFK